MGWVLLVGGVASGRVCACSLHSMLVLLLILDWMWKDVGIKPFLLFEITLKVVIYWMYCPGDAGVAHRLGNILSFLFMIGINSRGKSISWWSKRGKVQLYNKISPFNLYQTCNRDFLKMLTWMVKTLLFETVKNKVSKKNSLSHFTWNRK